MRCIVPTVAAALLAAPALAQDILHYKFDAGGGGRVINYASGSGIAPREGVLTSLRSPPTNRWVNGKFGGALSGAESSAQDNFVDTGWNGAFGGDFTVAWFMRQRAQVSIISYFFSGIGLFRCFTGGIAGTGLIVRGHGGSPDQLTLPIDVRAASAGQWLHLALVVDATRMTATWYVNGRAQPAIAMTVAPSVPAGSSFWVGTHTGARSPAWVFDTDELLFSNRAASAAEVESWAQNNPAAESAFGAGCNASLAATGGLPALNNPAYGLVLTAPAGSPVSLAIGLNRLQFGAAPLPLDLGVLAPYLAGCFWESSAAAFVNTVVGPGGSATFPLPIANNPRLVGFVLYNQAVLLSVATARFEVSNPHASAIGS